MSSNLPAIKNHNQTENSVSYLTLGKLTNKFVLENS